MAGLQPLNFPGTTVGTYLFRVFYLKDCVRLSPERGVRMEDFQEIGFVAADDLEDLFTKMQCERWSPCGEARELLRGLDIHHTSMSVGDLVQDVYTSRWHVVCSADWQEVIIKY